MRGEEGFLCQENRVGDDGRGRGYVVSMGPVHAETLMRWQVKDLIAKKSWASAIKAALITGEKDPFG